MCTRVHAVLGTVSEWLAIYCVYGQSHACAVQKKRRLVPLLPFLTSLRKEKKPALQYSSLHGSNAGAKAPKCHAQKSISREACHGHVGHQLAA